MYWVNGIFTKTISLNVRALHFGDGFFTTAKVKNGKIIYLDRHMSRLIFSAKKLMFNNIVNFDLLLEEMLQAAIYVVNGVIKVIISRVNNNFTSRGYQCSKNIESIRIICVSELPHSYFCWSQYGVRLKKSAIRLARNPVFAGIKHLNRLEQVMISFDICQDDMMDEALVLDTDGNVVECCSANIFWRQNNQVFTPSLYYAGVNGIMRQLIIELLPLLGYDIEEIITSPESLKDADEVFITNSLLPLAPVIAIDNYFYKNRKLFDLLNTYINEKM